MFITVINLVYYSNLRDTYKLVVVQWQIHLLTLKYELRNLNYYNFSINWNIFKIFGRNMSNYVRKHCEGFVEIFLSYIELSTIKLVENGDLSPRWQDHL